MRWRRFGNKGEGVLSFQNTSSRQSPAFESVCFPIPYPALPWAVKTSPDMSSLLPMLTHAPCTGAVC